MTDRYQRQTVLPEVGASGQERLLRSHVLIVGCGGLGGPVAAYLAGAGVGKITLVDGDRVETSNLHRQVFFSGVAGQHKAKALADHLRGLNDEIEVTVITDRFGPANMKPLIEEATLVVECTDDALTKHLISDGCHLLQVPLVYAAVTKYEGYVAVFPNEGPQDVHLRDLYPAPDPDLPNCSTVGILPTAVGLLALLQANAALCYLLQIGEPPVRALLTYSAIDNSQLRVQLQKSYDKPVSPPWRQETLSLEDKTTTWGKWDGYDGVFTVMDERQEPNLPEGVQRLGHRNPLSRLDDLTQDGGTYLVYCASGLRSMILVSQLRQRDPKRRVVSLTGGRQGRAPTQ